MLGYHAMLYLTLLDIYQNFLVIYCNFHAIFKIGLIYIKENLMQSDIVIALVQAILKLAPEVISIIEGLVGHGSTITPEQLPHLINQAVAISKNQSSSDSETLTASAQVPVVDNQSVKFVA